MIALGALRAGTGPSLQVIGHAGHLGEWKLSATVDGNAGRIKFSGPLTMTHVGMCTQDGPERSGRQASSERP